MTRGTRPAAYIRMARGGEPLALLAQRSAVCAAARAHGWAEPAVYVDVEGADNRTGGGERPELARLTAAISTGQHDALLIGVGTICGLGGDMVTLLASCSRHGVALECVTPPVAVAGGVSEPRNPPPA